MTSPFLRSSQVRCLVALTFTLTQANLSCGLTESHYESYPSPQKSGRSSPEICTIEVAAFSTYVSPMLKQRCTTGCHGPGGTAERQLIFTGDAAKDAPLLKKQEDGTVSGIFRKAAGITPHVGGKAALESDRERLEKWFAADKLCPSEKH